MSRERKVNVYCYHCNRTGIEYVTEEYRDGSWQYSSSALSEGWSRYNGGYILCPKCEHDPKAWREIKASRKRERESKRKKIVAFILTMPIAVGIAALMLHFMGPGALKYAAISVALGVVVCTFIVNVMLGVGFFVLLVFVVGLCVSYSDGNNASQIVNIPETNEVSHNIPTYLSDVDDITTARELGDFYFSIANKFYYNEMGLKGTQEQIDAGNKLMVRVYDFLGTSAKREMLDIDSMKVFIKNFAGVSDFRKEKALEDLQTGIRKIESLDE